MLTTPPPPPYSRRRSNLVTTADSRRHIATVVVLNWAYDIAQALSECHRVGYLHRDIAPGNGNFFFQSLQFFFLIVRLQDTDLRYLLLVLLTSPYHYEDLVDAIARGDKTPSPCELSSFDRGHLFRFIPFSICLKKRTRLTCITHFWYQRKYVTLLKTSLT